jgi:hypothetical protein
MNRPRHGLPPSNAGRGARITREAIRRLDRYKPGGSWRLTALGDLKTAGPQMVVGRCDRCGTVIEPPLDSVVHSDRHWPIAPGIGP